MVPFFPSGVMGVAALQSVYRHQPDGLAPESFVCPESKSDALSSKISGRPGFLREGIFFGAF